MAEELVFYTHPYSRGAIVHWMLEEVGCPYRIEVKEYGSSMKAPDYLSINPMGKVPAIRRGKTVVTESAAICAYLADTFPEAGLAPAVDDRGDYYRWLFFTAACLEPAYSNHAAGWDPATPEQEGRCGYGSYARVLDILADVLKDRTYIAGDKFTAADVYLASHLQWAMMTSLIGARPEFEAYRDAHINRPAALRAREMAATLSASPL